MAPPLMTLRMACLAGATALSPLAAAAQVLDLPASATQTDVKVEPLSSYRLPIGPWDDTAGKIQSIWAEGEVTQQAWHMQGEGLTTLQILAPLRAQLKADGFDILYECEAEDCGGFDFRYATEVLPEPSMHVDLGDFRFLSAQRMGLTQPEYIALLVSRSTNRGFLQVIRVGAPMDVAPVAVTTSTKTPDLFDATPEIEAPFAQRLEETGSAVLADLTFATGSSALEGEGFASLDALAGYLIDNPDRKVTLVGHTDAEGSLDGNIALSRKRAQSVMRRLIDDYGVPAGQLAAQGVGYLAPVSSNLTDDGRSQNRRVEVILTSTQ